MKNQSLTEYLVDGTQQALAAALGIQQSAVSQMLRSGRDITITTLEDGRIEAHERKPIPARPKNKMAEISL